MRSSDIVPRGHAITSCWRRANVLAHAYLTSYIQTCSKAFGHTHSRVPALWPHGTTTSSVHLHRHMIHHGAAGSCLCRRLCDTTTPSVCHWYVSVLLRSNTSFAYAMARNLRSTVDSNGCRSRGGTAVRAASASRSACCCRDRCKRASSAARFLAMLLDTVVSMVNSLRLRVLVWTGERENEWYHPTIVTTTARAIHRPTINLPRGRQP